MDNDDNRRTQFWLEVGCCLMPVLALVVAFFVVVALVLVFIFGPAA